MPRASLVRQVPPRVDLELRLASIRRRRTRLLQWTNCVPSLNVNYSIHRYGRQRLSRLSCSLIRRWTLVCACADATLFPLSQSHDLIVTSRPRLRVGASLRSASLHIVFNLLVVTTSHHNRPFCALILLPRIPNRRRCRSSRWTVPWLLLGSLFPSCRLMTR
jgi:hypothetical protein